MTDYHKPFWEDSLQFGEHFHFEFASFILFDYSLQLSSYSCLRLNFKVQIDQTQKGAIETKKEHFIFICCITTTIMTMKQQKRRKKTVENETS